MPDHFFTNPHILKHYLIIIPLLVPFKDSARTISPPTESRTVAAVDVYRMAAILEAEAIGEPWECQCLVGQVWVNRGKSNEGFARKKPSKRAIKLAKKILTLGYSHGLNYFYNPATSTDFEFLEWSKRFKKVRCGKQMFFTDD